ncbi:MAG: HPr(Ser) kinase/phosphatase [Verrucomicrobiales bacterium]
MKPKVKIPLVTVGDFYNAHGSALHLKLVGEKRGFDRRIREPTINRPGLALTGFTDYFARHRIQVLGNAEVAYLNKQSEAQREECCRAMCDRAIPAIVLARNLEAPLGLLKVAEQLGMSVFRTSMITMKFINAATIALEMDFAPSILEHGSMMEIRGIGVLVRGNSGVGKSECVLGLLARGHSLVADDVTRVTAIEGRELVAEAPEMTRGYIEVRGLGIIDVPAIFGAASLRLRKQLELVVTLKDWQDMESVERVGLEKDYYRILKIEVPHVTIPVRQGRDVARLVEIAALDQKLKCLGHHAAEEFNQKLIAAMRKPQENR